MPIQRDHDFKAPLYNLLQIREEILIVAGTLENVDLDRFRKGQVRRVKNDVVHPKWERDSAGKKVTTRYFDVGLIFLTEVGIICVDL